MPHKITLTGTPVSPLRQIDTYYTFDMEESGSAVPPKGLPSSSTITYTVLLNHKQLQKAGLTEIDIQSVKVMVQGEPTLDLSIEDCPGEIGIICFQISTIPDKSKKQKASEADDKVNKTEAPEKPKIESPKGTEDFISIDQITVPDAFLNSRPNPIKTQEVIDYVKRTGHLDEPIEINRETKILTDGYRRYIVAKNENMDVVPIAYEKQLQES